MCADEGRPVLAVLGAVLVADRDADDEGHLEEAGRHRLPLGGLVEELVARAAHEIAVHELDDGAAAREGVAHARADDRSLGDGAVEEPVVGQRLGEAAVHGEGAAPVAVLLAPGGHRRIDREAVQHRLEEAVAVLVELVLGDGLALGVEGVARLAGERLHAGVLRRDRADSRLPERPRPSLVEPLDLAVGEHDRLDEGAVDAGALGLVRREPDDRGELLDDRPRAPRRARPWTPPCSRRGRRA